MGKVEILSDNPQYLVNPCVRAQICVRVKCIKTVVKHYTILRLREIARRQGVYHTVNEAQPEASESLRRPPANRNSSRALL